MGLLYRAVWTDDREELIGAAVSTFGAWVGEKTDGRLRLPQDGERSITAGLDTSTARVERGSGGTGGVTGAVRLSLTEERGDGSRWLMTLRVWEGPACAADPGGGAGWLWVDVEAVAHDSLEGVRISAPRVVRGLLGDDFRPRRGGTALSGTPRQFVGALGAEQLAETLTDLERNIPVAVFTPLPVGLHAGDVRATLDPGSIVTAARRTAASAAGLVSVCLLDQPGVDALREILGEDYAVRDGAFRLYLPGTDPAVDEAWRHRYTLPTRYLRLHGTAARLVVQSVSLRATTRRAPDSYELARALLATERGKQASEFAELYQLAENDLDVAGRTVAQQRVELADAESRYFDLLEEHELVQGENADLRDRLHSVEAQLRASETVLTGAGLAHRYWNRAGTQDRHLIPVEAGSPSEAAQLAREHLRDHLVLPDTACVDLEDIDNAVESRAWGQNCWKALRALHAYAAAVASGSSGGSFWTWCANSGHPLVWPASSKKLALRESETVMANRKLRSRRMLPVDAAVDPSGQALMEAPIKIAEGGGNLAPRIYFLVSERTGSVHIGYFGPHRNMPNTLT